MSSYLITFLLQKMILIAFLLQLINPFPQKSSNDIGRPMKGRELADDINNTHYANLYDILFSVDRIRIRNVTVIGGHMFHKSLFLLSDYFLNAHIYGIRHISDNAGNDTFKSSCDRIHVIIYHNKDTLLNKLCAESMDLMIDYGLYQQVSRSNKLFEIQINKEKILHKLWSFVSPGGYYLIQGDAGMFDGQDTVTNPERLLPSTIDIFKQNHVYFIDVDIGTESWLARNSHRHILVIRRRQGKAPPIKINFIKDAMSEKNILPSTVTEITYPMEYLENLMFKYGTDKSKDDHGYVNVYSSLFPFYRRESISNVLELGVATGQSLQVFREYFNNATSITGLDNRPSDRVSENLKPLAPVVKIITCNMYKASDVTRLHFHTKPGRFDIIIEDGSHRPSDQETALHLFWPYLKPGGLFIIEDIDANKGGLSFKDPSKLESATVDILANNSVLFINCAVGHRDWATYSALFRSRFNQRFTYTQHNSYLLVIRKAVDRF